MIKSLILRIYLPIFCLIQISYSYEIIKKRTEAENPTRFNTIFAPVFSNYTFYDYTNLDCLIAWGSFNEDTRDLIKYAHERGTEVQFLYGDPGVGYLNDSDYRKKKIDEYVKIVTDWQIDGINFDFEDELRGHEKDDWVTFMDELKQEFNKLPSAEGSPEGTSIKITMDVAWTPGELWCAGGRCYPAYKISEVIDYLIIMGYDAEEDWWGRNSYGHATDPYYRLFQGLREYMDCLEIPPYKLILASPWYSWKMACKPADEQEPVEKRPPGREFQCNRYPLPKDRVNKDAKHTDFKLILEAFYDFEHRCDAYGNKIDDPKNFYHYSEIEDSYYFHVLNIVRNDTTDEIIDETIVEYWTTALLNDYKPYQNRLQLVIDSGVSGSGLWRPDSLKYDDELDGTNPEMDEIHRQFNKDMWKIYTEMAENFTPLQYNPYPWDEYLTSLCRKYIDLYVPPDP